MASKIKQFCIDHLVSILLVAIAITLALSAVGAWAKYTETLSSTTSIKLSIVDYTIDKAKMHKVMQGLSTKPTTVKFVKGTEVPTGLTNLATTTATGNSVAGIQQDDASMIGVFQSTDGTTLYIAPMNAPADGDTTGAAATAASNEFVMHTPTDSSKFLYGWGADAGGTGLRDYLTAIDVGNLDTSRTTDMRFMFGSNALVTSISNLSVFDTSNVTTMANMFNTTNKLTDFDVSGFNTSNVTSMTYMFANCNVAKTIDVSKFDTSKLESAYRVFYMCNAVEKLDFSSWNTNACTNMEQMFSACYKLSEVTLSKDFKWVNGSSTNGPLPTPNSTYITGATGSWYDTTSGDAYTPSALAGVTRTETRTYTAVPTYTIDKSKIQTQLRALAGSSTVPTAIKFVKGNDSAVSGLTNLYEAGIQDTNEKSAKIAIYQDGTTVYIAPADKNDSKSVMYAPKDCSNFLNGLESYTNLQNSLTTLELSNLDTSKVTTMSSMFNRLSALTSLDVSGFDTKNVTNMDYMFYCDSALTSLNVGAGVANTKFDTSNVTSMQGTFGELTKLTTLDISNFNTAKVKSMFYMFNNDNDSSLTTITFDTTKFDTSNVTNMQNMFKGCNALSSLDVSGFNTTKVTTMQNMFNGCKALKKLDVTSFDTSKVTKFDNMFNGCMYLTELDTSHFKAASNVTQTNGMFTDCQLLASIDLSNFSTTSTTNMANMFSRCYVLQSVTLGENFDFVGTDGYLPTPDSTYITGADGNWYDTVTGTGYTPADLATFHNNLNETRTYSVFKSYVIDRNNLWTALQGFASNSPTTIKFVKGSEVPTSGVTKSSTALQIEGSGEIGAWYESSSKTIYIAPNDSSDSKSALYTPQYAGYFLSGDSSYTNLKGSLTSIDVSNLRASNSVDLNRMFAYNYNLKTISGLSTLNPIKNKSLQNFFTGAQIETVDVTNLCTSSNTDCWSLFVNCSKLKTITGLETFDTSNVVSMQTMFNGCTNLTSVDLSSFDTSKVTSMYQMFQNCTALTTIYASNSFVTSAVTKSDNMFLSCTNLKGGAGTTYNSSYVDKTYARIDTASTPGYFTAKTSTVNAASVNDASVTSANADDAAANSTALAQKATASSNASAVNSATSANKTTASSAVSVSTDSDANDTSDSTTSASASSESDTSSSTTSNARASSSTTSDNGASGSTSNEPDNSSTNSANTLDTAAITRDSFASSNDADNSDDPDGE